MRSTAASIVTFFLFGVTNSVDAAEVTKHLDASGAVRAMYNIGFTQAGARGTELAKSFLRLHGNSLGITDVATEMQIVNDKSTEGGSHIRFNQTYQGIPVHQGEVVLSTTSRGEVGMLINNYRSRIRLSVASQRIGVTSAIAAVRAALPAQARRVGDRENVALVIWQDDASKYHLTYRVRFTTENPSGDWEAFVDAKSGSVLHIENRFANSGEVRVQGSGYVYLTDPLSAAKKRYGAVGFVDNNDGDTDSLSFYRHRVVLDSLTFSNGVYHLKGPYCEIVDIESPTDQLYANADRDGFNFTRSQQSFEAVNAYYHISKSYQYIQRLGFASATLAAIRVDPHGLSGEDNSHYSPNGNWIAFGEGGIDDAEDVDAILHEYGHAIVFNMCPTWGGGESGALGEGYSDYWAASYSRSMKGWAPSCYEYNWVYNWNAHNMFQLGRSVNDPRTYPFNTTDVHDAGQIWSSTLMAIWNDLGKEVTDKLVLKSLCYLGARATGVEAAQAIIQADRDLFGGAHLTTLVHWLGTVKHFIDPARFVPGIVHTPLTNISISNWAPSVSAQLSQVNPLEAAWVDYKVNSSILRKFALNEVSRGLYSSNFDIPASDVHIGDTIYYRISANYLDNPSGIATTPDSGFYSFVITGLPTTASERETPSEFRLSQNYPNPFNPTTNIQYILPEQSTVSIRVYSMLGQEITTLVSEVQRQGAYSVSWNGTNSLGVFVASGTYVYRLETITATGKHTKIQKKMVFLR